MTTIHHKRTSLLFFCFLVNLISISQPDQLPISTYVKMLSDKKGPASSGIDETYKALEGKDTAAAKKVLDEIEARGDLDNNYFKARFLAMKTKWINFNLQTGFRSQEEVTAPMLRQALNAAYETSNDSLISEIAWNYGEACYFNGRAEPATMFLFLAAELDEKIGKISSAYRCLLLGGMLHKTRDYRKSIFYTLASIQRETDTSANATHLLISRYNTVALCYQRLNIYDSAFMFFDVAMKLADQEKNTIWKAIISGNKGQIYFSQKKYDIAKSLLLFDYKISKGEGEPASAANSLQWVARINLAEGKNDSALICINEALDLIGQKYDLASPRYFENIYYVAAEAHRAVGNKDSALKYSTLYNNLHDSIERAIGDSRLEISRIKLDNFQNQLAIKDLQKEKAAVEQKRNLIIVLIILASIIALLYVNKMRLKHIHKEQLAQQEKAAAETSARDQLELLTRNMIEKTNLAEELQRRLNNRAQAIEQQELAATISNLTILTESDWEKFKKLFEQLHPGFFRNLQEKVPDITLAELRMAALTKLHLSTNQIAGILGISVNSVHKTKQRLRNRLNLNVESNIEDAISEMIGKDRPQS
jgi:DNA-binding CsgD family transcriptional regulator